MYRGPQSPSLTVLQRTPCPDHRPLQETLVVSKSDQYRPPLISALNSQGCWDSARDRYQQKIMQVIASLDRWSTVASLQINSRFLAEETLQPWIDLAPPRPARFRPAWTLGLDNKAARGKKLLETHEPGGSESCKTPRSPNQARVPTKPQTPTKKSRRRHRQCSNLGSTKPTQTSHIDKR